ncbi:MAG: efflux RND transporter periplasmic adaptor subunit [Planctomycetes bacterium]|nr:efflux RND transporter periplasmic adaptor subunit [Planctomycetota bacterium]
MSSRVLGIAGILSAVAWAGGNATPPAATATTPVEQPLIGVTVPSRAAAVAPEQAGKLVSLPFREGDHVAKDQVLFRLNSTLQELEVERLRPIAESNLIKTRAEANLAYEQRQTERLRDLRAQEIASDADLQEQEHELLIAQLRLQQAEIEQAQAENELKQAIEKLNQRSVSSPFDGVVTLRMKSEGESVERFVPVLEVMSFDPLWVEFDCPIRNLKDFNIGTRVVIEPSQSPDDARIGEVVLRSMKGNAASHTAMIRAAVSNADAGWRSGQKVLIRLAPPSGEGARPPKPGK